MTRISQAAYKRLRSRGRLVVNTTSVDHLMELRDTLRSANHPSHTGEGRGEGALSRTPSSQPPASAPDVRVWMINLARGTDQLDRLSFEPLKPSFLLAVTKL